MSERRTVTSAPRSEEHTSELQSQSNLVCRIIRSEEHTSELQSQSNLVCRLLLEKKNASQIRLKKRNTPPMTSPTVLANAPTAGRAESRAEKAIIAKLIKSPKTPIRI